MRPTTTFALMLLWAGPALALAPKDIYKKAGPAVVLILGSDDGKTGSGGTGSIITPDGQVITNGHVVLNEAGHPFKTLFAFLKPPVVTGDARKDLTNRYNVRVLAYSPPEELDLALLKLEKAPSPLPTIAFADPDKVEVGDQVVAIGHPEQGGLWTMTTGAISTVIANFNQVKGKDVFQTEASVNRGNSGGPLLDADANMVAINTMIARQGAGGVAITGINFSLKSSVAVKWLAGQGMGLAYAPKGSTEMMVASAAQPTQPAVASAQQAQQGPTRTEPGPAATVSSPPQAMPQPASVAEQPSATIVMVQKAPAQPEKLRVEGANMGKAKGSEKVTAGKMLDPAKAKPKYETEKRPYSLDDLRRQQMKDLEDIMQESRQKIEGGKGKTKFDDMGLQ